MEGSGRGRLFIGALKLLSFPETIRYSSPVHIHSGCGLGARGAGYSPLIEHPCIAPINSLPLPLQKFDSIKLTAGEGEYLFFDAMHGSTEKRASNVEPN